MGGGNNSNDNLELKVINSRLLTSWNVHCLAHRLLWPIIVIDKTMQRVSIKLIRSLTQKKPMLNFLQIIN